MANEPHTGPADTPQGVARAATPSNNARSRRSMVSIFGDITRSGSWPPQQRMTPVAVFGDIDLDFRQANLPAGDVIINAYAPFGDIDVLVPKGVAVSTGGFTLFGSKRVSAEEASSAAVVRVRGFSVFGSLKVRSG